MATTGNSLFSKPGKVSVLMAGEPIKEQPKWCGHPEADRPFWGCWSLLAGYVKGEDYCKKCDAYKGARCISKNKGNDETK